MTRVFINATGISAAVGLLVLAFPQLILLALIAACVAVAGVGIDELLKGDWT